MNLSYREKVAPFRKQPAIEPAVRHLCWITALLALGEEEALREAIGLALEEGVSALDIREAMLQSYLFVGYPRAINALSSLHELCRERGSGIPQGAHPFEDYDDWADWEKRGEALCRRIYGDRYDRLRNRIGELHPQLARWMIVEGYGKVLARDGIPAGIREMLVVCTLTAQAAWRQLRAHLRGGLRLGITRDELEGVIRQLAPFLPEDRVETAIGFLESAASERTGE